jgi:methyl-accepting chemotaxis protein
MNTMTITTRLRLLFAIPLIWVTLVGGMCFIFLYVEGRSNKHADDTASYSPQVLTKIVALLSQSVDAFESLASTDQILRQDVNIHTQQISNALLNHYFLQTEKKFLELNRLITMLANASSSLEEKTLSDSIARAYQDNFRTQLLFPSIDASLSTNADLAGRLSKANLSLQLMLKDIDALTNLIITNIQIRQTQYQTSLENYEHMVWGTIISLLVMIVLMSWMGIDFKIALRKILGASPEEIDSLVDQIFKSRLGVDVISEATMPKNVKTALIVFPETLMRFFSDIKVIHKNILIGDHLARFNLREHHPESRETLGLINAILDHIVLHPPSPLIEVQKAATTLPEKTSHSSTLHSEDILQRAVDAANEKIANSDEFLKQILSLSEDIAQSMQTLQESHGVNLKLNQSHHAELEYVGDQTIALLNLTQRLPDRLLEEKKLCDALITSTLEEKNQLSIIDHNIDLVQKNIQEVRAQLSILENIALQGDMLSFNIAIEVARLGDEGRGFSAIGSEIRHLAERAMVQTHSIRALISDTDTGVISAHESLSHATLINKELLGCVSQINALTQSSAETANTSIEGLTALANAQEQIQGHSLEQVLLTHHESIESSKLNQLLIGLVHSLGGTSNDPSSSNQTMPLNVVNDDGVFASTPLVAAVNSSSIYSDKTTEQNLPASGSKPISNTDWSLF